MLKYFYQKIICTVNQSPTNENNKNYSSLNAEKNSVSNSNGLANTPNQTTEKKDFKEKEGSNKQESTNPETQNELEEILKAKSGQKNCSSI